MNATVVIPTYNEARNLEELIGRIFRAVPDIRVVIVDDDSSDGTGKIAEQLSREYNIKVIHRKGKLGLSSAVIDGFGACDTKIIGVMDADLSHPPELIPKMLGVIENGEADVVFGSRYVKEGGIKKWPLLRKITSMAAIILARPLTGVRDSVSGFFFLRRDVIKNKKLNPRGFKIGLDILVKGDYRKVVEVPYTFVDRTSGRSKLNAKEYLNYLSHLISLYAYELRHL